MFDEQLIDSKQIKINKNKYYYYLLNTECVNNHINIINKIYNDIMFID
jgi:hypothetical protein